MITFKDNDLSPLAKQLSSSLYQYEETLDPKIYHEIMEQIENILCFVIENEDRQKVEELRKDLSNRVKDLTSEYGKKRKRDISSESMEAIFPIGIARNKNNCAFNALGQLLMGAPNVLKAISEKATELNDILIQYTEAQNKDGNVLSQDFGTKLRDWVSSHLKGADQEEWFDDEGDIDDTQIDVRIPLELILETAGIQYFLKQNIDKDGETHTIRDENTGNPILATHKTIELDLSKDKHSFMEFFEDFFEYPIEGTNQIKRIQLNRAPDDLFISAFRFGYKDGLPQKIGKKIRKVPLGFRNGTKPGYILTGCIIHKGKSLGSGHYLTLRRVGNNWFLINDEIVTPVEDPSPFLEEGYIFHFQKGGTEPFLFEKKPRRDQSEVTHIQEDSIEPRDTIQKTASSFPGALKKLFSW